MISQVANEDIMRELRALRAYLEELRTERHALKRAEAARAMGISRRKLEKLIAAGKVRTAEDPHLVPVAEVKRYCAPKTPRGRNRAGRRPALVIDETSPEAVAAMKRELRRRRLAVAR